MQRVNAPAISRAGALQGGGVGHCWRRPVACRRAGNKKGVPVMSGTPLDLIRQDHGTVQSPVPVPSVGNIRQLETVIVGVDGGQASRLILGFRFAGGGRHANRQQGFNKRCGHFHGRMRMIWVDAEIPGRGPRSVWAVQLARPNQKVSLDVSLKPSSGAPPAVAGALAAGGAGWRKGSSNSISEDGVFMVFRGGYRRPGRLCQIRRFGVNAIPPKKLRVAVQPVGETAGGWGAESWCRPGQGLGASFRLGAQEPKREVPDEPAPPFLR